MGKRPLFKLVITSHFSHWGRFLLRQSDLTDLARCVCRSFITYERSTLRSLISDVTTRTARIFVGGFSWTASDSSYAGVFKFLAPKR